MNRYADCTYCGGEVIEQAIDYDYRSQKTSNGSEQRPRRCWPPVQREVFLSPMSWRKWTLYITVSSSATKNPSEP